MQKVCPKGRNFFIKKKCHTIGYEIKFTDSKQRKVVPIVCVRKNEGGRENAISREDRPSVGPSPGSVPVIPRLLAPARRPDRLAGQQFVHGDDRSPGQDAAHVGEERDTNGVG